MDYVLSFHSTRVLTPLSFLCSMNYVAYFIVMSMHNPSGKTRIVLAPSWMFTFCGLDQ